MATSIQSRSGGFQLRVVHKLLPKPFFHTFDERVKAENYRDQLLVMLDNAVVPQEMLIPRKSSNADSLGPLVYKLIGEYQASANVAPSDQEMLDRVTGEVMGVRFGELTYDWVSNYLRLLKSPKRNLAPSSIRKRIESLARVIDWYILKTTKPDEHRRANPLRLLPRGYSAYSRDDAKRAPPKRDIQRDSRLQPGQHEQILRVFAGEHRPDRERALFAQPDPAFELFYRLIVDTGLRMFEAYRLTVGQIDFSTWTINVSGSKGHHGAVKKRVVPIKRELRELLRNWCAERTGFLFPFWDGSEAERKRTQLRLTSRFKTLFSYAGIEDFTEHDLRHEAACRWFQLRNLADTGWAFSETEICRIMGWTDTKMALRYLSLRGEDLSARLG
jgi:integrase